MPYFGLISGNKCGCGHAFFTNFPGGCLWGRIAWISLSLISPVVCVSVFFQRTISMTVMSATAPRRSIAEVITGMPKLSGSKP